MAQLLFESVPASVSGVQPTDNQTVLTVHSMLDPQLITHAETGSVLDDSDVFQCGKCKKQFLSIDVFVNHKTECNSTTISPISDITNVCGLPQNTVVVRKIQLPSSSLSNYPQSLVLTDADLLHLSTAGLDPASTSVATSNPSNQITPSYALMPQSSFNSQTVPATVQHVLQQVATQDNQQPQTVELSFINDKFISRPVILTSQQHNSAISGLVLNISNPSQSQTVLCNSSESGKTNGIIVESVAEEPMTSVNNSDQNDTEKEPNTINIITEFHSSAVKNSKKTTETEGEENQTKKDHKLNCAYCWKSFTKNFDLQQHIRCHTGEKPFQCIVCGRAFAQKSNVKKHMQTHKVWPDGLSRTLPRTSSKSNLQGSEDGEVSHDNSDSPDIQNETDLEKSNSGEVDKNSYVCPYCNYIGKSYYKLKSHMKQHDTEKVYKCILSSCGRMFNELDPFLEHTKSHENEMTYRCHECNRNFRSLYDLGSHQFTHSLYPSLRSRTARRFFRCNLCLNKYSTPAALDHHLATTNHTYSCCWCDKIFPCERYLRRHLQIHSESESYTCKVCGKGFKTESYLKVHMLVHSEEKPYECSICKAAFNRKDKLKRHLLIHEPVKRYKCPFRTHCGCPKEFNRPDKLKAHILTHSCIKPFACRVCGKNFTRKAHLRDHVKQNHDEEDLKLLNEEEQSLEKGNSAISFSDSDDAKSHLRNKSVFPKKRKDFSHNYRLRQQRKRALGSKNLKNGNCGMKRRGKSKKIIRLEDLQENSKDPELDANFEISDDIPTAHIEIISTHGTLVASTDLTHISLASDMGYNDLQFDPTVDETVGPSSPSVSVDAIHSTNSNSLLASELQTAADMSDYS